MSERRRRILILSGAALAGLLAVGFLLNRLVFRPAADLDREAAKLQGEIASLKSQIARKPAHEARLRSLAARMMNGSENQVSERLSATVLELLGPSRMGGRLSAQPLSPILVAQAYKEIGQTISVRGRLEHVVDFLYLLDAQPFLHRLDNVVLSRNAATGDVDLTARYATLIFDPARGARPPASMPATAPEQEIDTPERRRYDAIAARDLFRPYVRRIVEPPPRQPPAGPPPPPPGPAEPPRVDFRLVALPNWNEDGPEIGLRNIATGEIRYYRPGDSLAGGRIVMVDYRALPSPRDPELLSTSRIILKIGEQYWAVEIEDNLSDKRVLKASDLPPGIDRAASQPARPAEARGLNGAQSTDIVLE